MTGDAFYWLLSMSIVGGVVGLIVLLIGRIKRLPRRLACGLWLLPFLRMWIPVGIAGEYSLMWLLSKFTTKTVVVYEGTQKLTMMNAVMAADSYFPITYKTDLLADVFRVASWVWLVIAAAILITLIVLYCITLAELKDATYLRDNLYLSDKITSPAVYGVLRPRIILPAGYEKRELTYILAHEKAHIRRRDNLWRILAFVTAAIHWFNPLVWIFLKQFLTEIELAYDERVLAKLGEGEKKRYALDLLDCAAQKNAFASAFGGAKVRVRIGRILSYKKLSVLSAICFAALAAAVAYVLLTNAA